MKRLPLIVKLLLFILPTVLIAFGVFIFFLSKQLTALTREKFAEPTPTVTPTIDPSHLFTYNNRTYAFLMFSVSDHTTLSLFPNFTEQKSIGTLKDQESCKQAVNAGFYSKEQSPLGLWDNGEEHLGNALTSLLFNGFYWVDKNNAPHISANQPSSYRLAVQSGPLLLTSSQPLKLAIKNDEYARRMVAGVTQDGKTIFLTIFDPESTYSGPLLAELPLVLTAMKSNLPSFPVSAINLDGGSASAFSTPERTLSELTPIGSMFCVK